MARKTGSYKPPFLCVSVMAEGESLLFMTADRPVNITARSFTGLCKLHPGARKTAIAITLLEVARSLLAEPSHESDLINSAVASLVLDELPMQDFSIPDDFPF